MLYYSLWIALTSADGLKAVNVCRKSLSTNATANKPSESYQQHEQQQQWEHSPRYGINFLIKQRAPSEKNNNNNIRAKHRKITKTK